MCSWQGPNKRPLHDELSILGMEKQTMEENWRKPPETKWVMVQELNPWQVLQIKWIHSPQCQQQPSWQPHPESSWLLPALDVWCQKCRQVALLVVGWLSLRTPAFCPQRWRSVVAWTHESHAVNGVQRTPQKTTKSCGTNDMVDLRQMDSSRLVFFFSQPINIDKGTTVTDVQNCNRQYKVCSLDKTSESTKLPHSKCTWVF